MATPYGDDLKTFLAEIDNLSETDLEKAYTKLKSDAERVWEYCGFDKRRRGIRRKTGQGVKNEEPRLKLLSPLLSNYLDSGASGSDAVTSWIEI